MQIQRFLWDSATMEGRSHVAIQAAAVEKRFRKAWKRSDVTLAGSRFMEGADTNVAAVSGN